MHGKFINLMDSTINQITKYKDENNPDQNKRKQIIVSGYVCEKGIGDYFMFIDMASVITKKFKHCFELFYVVYITNPAIIPKVNLQHYGILLENLFVIYEEAEIERTERLCKLNPDLIIHTACRPNRAILAKYSHSKHIACLEYEQAEYKVYKIGIDVNANGIFFPMQSIKRELEIPWEDTRLQKIVDNNKFIFLAYFSNEHFLYDVVTFVRCALNSFKTNPDKATMDNPELHPPIVFIIRFLEKRYINDWKKILSNQIISLFGTDMYIQFVSMANFNEERKKNTVYFITDAYPLVHSDMMKILNKCQNPVGITGNASFSEVVALEKIPYFEYSITKPMVAASFFAFYNLYKIHFNYRCDFYDFLINIDSRQFILELNSDKSSTSIMKKYNEEEYNNLLTKLDNFDNICSYSNLQKLHVNICILFKYMYKEKNIENFIIDIVNKQFSLVESDTIKN